MYKSCSQNNTVTTIAEYSFCDIIFIQAEYNSNRICELEGGGGALTVFLRVCASMKTHVYPPGNAVKI